MAALHSLPFTIIPGALPFPCTPSVNGGPIQFAYFPFRLHTYLVFRPCPTSSISLTLTRPLSVSLSLGNSGSMVTTLFVIPPLIFTLHLSQ